MTQQQQQQWAERFKKAFERAGVTVLNTTVSGRRVCVEVPTRGDAESVRALLRATGDFEHVELAQLSGDGTLTICATLKSA